MIDVVTTVTRLTKDATTDEYTTDDYRDMYDEIRGKIPDTADKYAISIDDFIDLVGSRYSKGQWSKYHKGKIELNRQMRTELRRGVNQPELPPTVAEAVSAASLDAEVVQVGTGQPDRIIMACSASEPMTIHLNGGIVATAQQVVASECHVTTVTRSPRRSIHVGVDMFDRLNSARLGRDLQWAEFLAGLLPNDGGE